MEILRKYGVATDVYFPLIKRGVVDFAVAADFTHSAGDTKISKDGGAAANTTNAPSAITMGNGATWKLTLTATEMQAAKIVITVIDAATKAVEDQQINIATYGNASAEHAVDLDDSVRAGLTALPNAAAEAAGGLYTRGSGAGQINQNANGQVDTRWVAGNVTVGTNNDKTSYTLSAAGIQAIWDALTSALTTAGSIGKLLVDNIDAAVSSRLSTAGYTAPDNATITTISNKLGAFTASGLNTVLGFFRAVMRKDAALTPSDVGGTFDNTTDSQEATKDNQLDAAVSTRATQGSVDSVQADTNDIQTRLPAALESGRMASALDAAGNAAIADKLLGRTRAGGADGGRTVAQCLAFGRNRWAIAAGTLTVYADDDTTPLFTAAVTTAPGDPVTQVDPV